MKNYADITVNDKNPVKRKLQRLRLLHGLLPLKYMSKDFSGKILDFGSGDGELCKKLSQKFPNAEIYCYEPVPELYHQAEINLKSSPTVILINSLHLIKKIGFDYIFCFEVLEHLPESQLNQALERILCFTKSDSQVIFGVPNELHLPALIKGIFRLTRRYGEVDALPGNIIKAFTGRPPKKRKVVELSPGIPYIIRHIGFDYRELQSELTKYFIIKKTYGSPGAFLPIFFNFEIFYLCTRKTTNNMADTR